MPTTRLPSQGPLIVEFIGLPGAGKTAVAHALLCRLGADGARVLVTAGAHSLATGNIDVPPERGAARINRLARMALFLVRRWRLVRAVARYGSSVRPRTMERLGFLWSVLGYGFQLGEHRIRSVDVVVLDQATLQAAWSVAVRGSRPRPEDVRSLVTELANDGAGRWAVVHFDIREEAALERIARRPTNTSRFDHMSPAEAMALLPDLRQYLDVLARAVGESGVPCIRLDAHGPIDETCEAITEFVHRLSSSRSDPCTRTPSWCGEGGSLDA